MERTKPRGDGGGTASAAILLVGNELLTGKIQDQNGHFLARVLRRRGIRLVEISVIEDDVDAIGSAVGRLLAAAPLLFTSGGVGPTHDDLTLAGVARGTGRPLQRNAEMETQLRAHFGADITTQALSMADIPEGTRLVAPRGWPVLRLDVPNGRIYMLPGVPDLLRAKVEALEALEDELPSAGGWELVRLLTTIDESDLAGPLDRVVDAFPEVDIGSYPRWRPDRDGRLRCHVRVTFEAPAARPGQAQRAREHLRALLPAHAIVGESDGDEPAPGPGSPTADR